ncbi:hypothetical protein QAD02_005871 [Eretmocerus hayati]|uniref:Uncharacterized protein n=1 Tax=Eretmocerus hayati TaxID=131215 RepID=A0ACC2NU33_9HYME|nr:hypothetical protein QAD02_005871 [Eretmocerus hayati]
MVRWTKEYCKEFHRVFVRGDEGSVQNELTISEKQYNVSNERELKKIMIQEKISDLTDIISVCNSKKFDVRYSTIQEILFYWAQKTPVFIEARDEEVDLSHVTTRFTTLNLHLQLSGRSWDVPKKRREISNLLKQAEEFADDDGLDAKLAVLEDLWLSWVANKYPHITLRNGDEVRAFEDHSIEGLRMPNSPKRRSRPKGALKTNVKYGASKRGVRTR